MSALLLIPILVPLLGAALLLALPRLREEKASHLATSVTLLWGASCVLVALLSIFGRLDGYAVEIFSWEQYRFFLQLHADKVGITFLLLSAFLGGVIVRFSHYYMHREPGHRRFFVVLLVFFLGLSLASLSNDLESFFMGWEIVGIASFLLIGFYRSRLHPIRNALRVYAIYRLCDVGLLLGAYFQNADFPGFGFDTLGTPELVGKLHALGQTQLLILSLPILLSALGKSAQLPFSFWIPRAMEGPTPSSAVFYGALSIHAGVLLLLRTFPIWSASNVMPWLIGGIGILTAILSTGMGRVQSNVKAQIGYGSVTQVGLIFLELALGWKELALFHLVGNACFRCYQLLVSPSVVGYLLRLQSSSVGARTAVFSDWSVERLFPEKVRYTMYSLATHESYFPMVFEHFIWRSLRRTASDLRSGLDSTLGSWMLGTAGVTFAVFSGQSLILLVGALVAALLFSLYALGGFGSASRVWISTSLASFILSMTFIFNGDHALEEAHLLAPFLAFHLLWLLLGLTSLRPSRSEWLSFIAILGATGFPISPVYFGEDVLLHSALSIHLGVAGVFTFIFVLNGVALMRMHTRVFLMSQIDERASV